MFAIRTGNSITPPLFQRPGCCQTQILVLLVVGSLGFFFFNDCGKGWCSSQWQHRRMQIFKCTIWQETKNAAADSKNHVKALQPFPNFSHRTPTHSHSRLTGRVYIPNGHWEPMSRNWIQVFQEHDYSNPNCCLPGPALARRQSGKPQSGMESKHPEVAPAYLTGVLTSRPKHHP